MSDWFWQGGTDQIVPLDLDQNKFPAAGVLVAPDLPTFRARFPEFAPVSDALVTLVLVEASGEINGAWRLADQQPAMLYYAAHILATQGYGVGSVSIGGQNVVPIGPLKQIKEGDTSLTYERATSTSATTEAGSGDDLQATSYGRRFATLRARNALFVMVV